MAMTTCQETISEKITRLQSTDPGVLSPTDRDLLHAYWHGVSVGARRVCDKAREIFAEQARRAEGCRYHLMARSIIEVPGISDGPMGKMIYDGAYGDDFGDWEIEIQS